MARRRRGGQVAFNKSGNLCISGFIDEDVKCFETSTGAPAAGVSPGRVPAGLALSEGPQRRKPRKPRGCVVRDAIDGLGRALKS